MVTTDVLSVNHKVRIQQVIRRFNMCKIKDEKRGCQKIFNGDFFITNEGYDVVVTNYINSKNIWVQFLDDFGYECKVEARQLKLGRIKNPYHKSVRGVGYLGIGEFLCYTNNELTREYKAWSAAMNRCYSENRRDSDNNYIGCTIHEDWHNFQVFAKWYVSQKGYGMGYELDKDLLVEGNRVYGATTCCLVPKEINNFLVLRKNDRGKYPLGVHYDKNAKAFVARIQVGSDRISLGKYGTPEEAFEIYKKNKELLAVNLAYKYKDTINERVFKHLLRFKITGKR